MIGGPPDPFARAQRSLRWYPAQWRDRYGDEFCELLAADIADRPSSARRGLDVAAGGIMARLADAGLVGVTINRSDRPRRSLATFACSIAVFLTVAMSIYSHLEIAQEQSLPATSTTHSAIAMMAVSLWACLALAAAAASPIVWYAARAASDGRASQIRRPAVVFLAGAALLVLGSLHFSRGWDGSLAMWTGQSHSRVGPVSLMWSSTVAVSAYWAHPTILSHLPLIEIAWMTVSPMVLVATVTAAAKVVRRLDIPTRSLRFVERLSRLMTLTLGVFVFGMVVWLVDGGPGPGRLFEPGTVDRVGLGVLTVALGVSALSAHRAADLSL